MSGRDSWPGRLGVRVRIRRDAERHAVAGHQKRRCSQQGFLGAPVPEERESRSRSRGRSSSPEAVEGGEERCAKVAEHPLDERRCCP